jgi:hypothetical protein
LLVGDAAKARLILTYFISFAPNVANEVESISGLPKLRVAERVFFDGGLNAGVPIVLLASAVGEGPFMAGPGSQNLVHQRVFFIEYRASGASHQPDEP